ncbi:MAG: hypothetical protein K2J40_09095 [Ruminococcus sp.]|nr:hypothetical protein [Ruminococcus sp.]
MTYNFYFVISGAVLFLIGRLLYGKKDIAGTVLMIISAVVFWLSKIILAFKLMHSGAGILSAIIFVFFGGLASCGLYVNYFDFIDVPLWALIIFILIDIACVFEKLIIHTDKSE